MKLLAVPYSSISKDDWDAFCLSSDEAWLWHTYDFQDALGTWPYYEPISSAIVDEDAGQIVALLPLHLVRGQRIDSLCSYARSNSLTQKQKKHVLKFIAEYLFQLAEIYAVSEINLSLSPMAPAYAGENCPRVNPLLWLGCANSLTQTWVVDLRDGGDAVWKKMEGRARTAIKKAGKNQLDICLGKPEDLDAYYGLHCQTYARSELQPHSKQYFQIIFDRFIDSRTALILFAYSQDSIVAAANFGIYKSNAIYWTGASSELGLKLEASSFLQWHAIQWFLKNSFNFYETGEAFPYAKNGKEKGLNDFKKSFGGEIYPYYKGKFNSKNKKYTKSFAKKCIKRVLPLKLKTYIKEMMR